MKPIILFTLHRRYTELCNSIGSAIIYEEEFDEKPYILVVWADPEPSRRWILDQLLELGAINEVLERPKLSKEGETATTYPESHNINFGINYIRANLVNRFPDCYVIVQAADCGAKRGAYKLINHDIKECDGIVYRWQNNCGFGWHTNFFVAKPHREFPPLCQADEGDVLEVKWARTANFERFNQTHNSGERVFVHRELNDKSWAHIPIKVDGRCMFFLKSESGYEFYKRKGLEWLRSIWHSIL